jgi:hypothetical protein
MAVLIDIGLIQIFALCQSLASEIFGGRGQNTNI